MSTVEFHPWNSRRDDTEQPDEWRIDLDPGPLCDYATVRRVAHVVHEVLDELGAVGFPKTSGSKGMHVYVRIPPDHGFKDVRRAAFAFAREVERRSPDVDHDLVDQGPRPPPALRRLQPERARPHHRRGVLGARAARRPGLDADPVGRGRRRRPPRLHDLHRARSGSPSSATCTPTSTTTSSTSPRCWSGPSATSARAGKSPDPDPRLTARGHPDHPEHPQRRLRRPRRPRSPGSRAPTGCTSTSWTTTSCPT